MKNKKISEILIGSNNPGKLREITSLLPKNVKVFSTKDFNLKSPKETGKTFKSNALIKAKYFSKKTDLICLSDDSGLEIDLLKKKPGIYSARWGGKKNDFKLNNKVFDQKNTFKGKIGLFEIEEKRIKHVLNFYKVENNKFKKIF